MLTCPSCALELPPFARFCARCGAPLPGARAVRPAARGLAVPVWVLVVVWLVTAGLAWIALLYAVVAAGAVPPEELGRGPDAPTLRATAAIVALIATSLCLAHLAAAIGLTGGWGWARPLATIVFVTWALTCVGLPLALLALTAMWRPSRGRPGRPAPTA